MFKAIAKNLIPENFRENALINDVISIFTDYIWENSNIAIDIANLYDSKNKVLYEEIIKTYAANFFKTISDGSKNHKLTNAVRRAHEKWGFKLNDSKLDIAAVDLLSREQLELFKNFQQSKGTLRSIEFIYRIIEQLDIESFALESQGELKIYPGKNIFEYVVEGSMLPEIFEAFVKPLAHPVGWVCIYLRLYHLKFIDYFSAKEVYHVNVFRIVCENSDKQDNFKTNKGYLFENDENGQPLFSNTGEPRCYEANGQEANNVTRFGETYKKLTLNSELILVGNPTIRTIEQSSIKGNNKLTVYFESGEYLEQNSKPRSLILYYGRGPNDLNQKIKKDYTRFLENCALELNYDREVVTTLNDNMKSVIDFGLANTMGKIAAVGAGNVFVGAKGYRLGDFLINPNIPITWDSRVSNKILKSTSFKALIKTNENKERRVFSRVKRAPYHHIKIEKARLYKKEGDYFYMDIRNESKYFIDCLDYRFRKIAVKTVLTEKGFRIYSKNPRLYVVHWEDILSKVRKIGITEESYIESEEEDLKLGKYFIESEKPPLSLYTNNNYVSFNLRHSDDKWYIFTDAREPGILHTIDEERYEENEALLQLKLIPITFNKQNNYKVQIPLSNSYILRYFNQDTNIKIESSIDIRYDDIEGDFIFDNIILSIEPPEDNSEVTSEIQYLLNITEMKSLVYFENYLVELDELPIAVSLNEETVYINDEDDLARYSDILKIYFDLDIRNQRVKLQAVDKDIKLLERRVFDFNPRYKTLKSNFDCRMMKFEYNNFTSYLEHELPLKQYFLAAFNSADDEVKVQVKLMREEEYFQVVQVETDKNLRLFYLDDTEDEYQIEIVEVEDYDFSNCYILYYFKNDILDYYSGDKALIIKNLDIIETKQFGTIAEAVKIPEINFDNIEQQAEMVRKKRNRYIKIPDNKFPLNIKKDEEKIELLKTTQLVKSEFRTKLATKVDTRYIVDLLKDTGETYKYVFDKQIQKTNRVAEEDLYNYEFEKDYMNSVGEFSAHETTTYSKYIGTRHKKLYKIEQTPSHGFICTDDFSIDFELLGSTIDVSFKFEDRVPEFVDFLQMSYSKYYQNKWGWQSGYVDVYSTLKKLPRFSEVQEITEEANLYQMDDYIVIGKNDISQDYFFKPYPIIYDKMLSFKPLNIIETDLLLNTKTGFYEFNLQPKQYPLVFVNTDNEEIVVDYRIENNQIVIKSRKKIDRRLLILDDRRDDFEVRIGEPSGSILTYLTPKDYFTLVETEKALNITKVNRNSRLIMNFLGRSLRSNTPLRQTLDINYSIRVISNSNEVYGATSPYNSYSKDVLKNGQLSPLLTPNEVNVRRHYRNVDDLG